MSNVRQLIVVCRVIRVESYGVLAWCGGAPEDIFRRRSVSRPFRRGEPFTYTLVTPGGCL